MEQKALAKWLRLVVVLLGLCGLAVYFLLVPGYGLSLRSQYPEFSNRFWPWLGFLWASGLPCWAVLVLGWRIAGNIGRDASFSLRNARYLKWISWLAGFDAVFFFLGNLVLLFLNLSHPGVTLLSLLVVFAGAAIAVASAALSHLVQKAALLQEESDLTI
ncbi:MAG: DUF2975 domain-containing protein [Oscillospiraceae bacterium]|nr:DUF2975 domain-containing protein [Oscillospiraceae bacterium]